MSIVEAIMPVHPRERDREDRSCRGMRAHTGVTAAQGDPADQQLRMHVQPVN